MNPDAKGRRFLVLDVSENPAVWPRPSEGRGRELRGSADPLGTKPGALPVAAILNGFRLNGLKTRF